jgi:hypothetical protein
MVDSAFRGGSHEYEISGFRLPFRVQPLACMAALERKLKLVL